MDPITNLTSVGRRRDEIKAMLTRVIDFLKSEGITTIFTSLTSGGSALEQSEVGISSLMDTWLLLRMVESASERNRMLYVLKSRGMAHSNQMREFVLSDDGIELVDVYTGPGTVYTGSARLVQEAQDAAEALADRAGRPAARARTGAGSPDAARPRVQAMRLKLERHRGADPVGEAQEKDRLADRQDGIAKQWPRSRKAD